MQLTHFLDIYNGDIPSSLLSLNQNSIKSEFKKTVFLLRTTCCGFGLTDYSSAAIEESRVCTYILNRRVIRSPWNYQTLRTFSKPGECIHQIYRLLHYLQKENAIKTRYKCTKSKSTKGIIPHVAHRFYVCIGWNKFEGFINLYDDAYLWVVYSFKELWGTLCKWNTGCHVSL